MITAHPYDQFVAGNIAMLSREFGIPQQTLRGWQREGALDRRVVTEQQWLWLHFIKSFVWQNRSVLRSMLAALPRAERRKLVDQCEKRGIELIVYRDFLRFKLRGTGVTGDGQPVTFEKYLEYLKWRHPEIWHLLDKEVFIKQRKAALARISYARQTGRLAQLMSDMGVT